MSAHRRRARTQDDFPGRGRAASEHKEPFLDTSSHASRYAHISRLATDQGDNIKETQAKLNDVDPNLLARIQKMLKLAQHPNTSEAEARQALRASTRMLSAANLTEAEVMSHENAEEQLQRAGHSIVTVRHKDGKAVALEAWATTLGHAIDTAFNVKFFFTRFSSHVQIDYTFYGLRDNTVAAAVSFEAVFNLALAWAARRTDVKGRTGKNSYLVGLSDSLYRMAKREKIQEETKAIETEKQVIRDQEQAVKRDEQRRADRLEPTALPSPSQTKKATKVEDDDDDDDVVFVRVKPGHRVSSGGFRVKDEPIDLDEDDEDDFGSFAGLGGGSGGQGNCALEGEEDVEDDIGDLDTERRRFDAVFANQPKVEVLQEHNSNATVKAEQLCDDVVRSKTEDGAGNATASLSAGVSVKDGSDDETTMPSWQSRTQLVAFKESAARLADDYLASINTKLNYSKARRKPTMRDNDAYNKGREDGRKVDLKRRRLE